MTEDEIQKLLVEALDHVLNEPDFVENYARELFEGWKAYLKITYDMTPEEYSRKHTNPRDKP